MLKRLKPRVTKTDSPQKGPIMMLFLFTGKAKADTQRLMIVGTGGGKTDGA
jgi:hypothetical protein